MKIKLRARGRRKGAGGYNKGGPMGARSAISGRGPPTAPQPTGGARWSAPTGRPLVCRTRPVGDCWSPHSLSGRSHAHLI
jgi:hypothetical protein